jgi:Pyridoxamine 5'-phosphate oxidase like
VYDHQGRYSDAEPFRVNRAEEADNGTYGLLPARGERPRHRSRQHGTTPLRRRYHYVMRAQTKDRSQAGLDRVWEIIEKIGVCMLTTQFPGGLRARPLEARPDRNAGVIWFVTESGIGTRQTSKVFAPSAMKVLGRISLVR